MTDPYGLDETDTPDLEIGDPDRDSTWNTLIGTADADELLNADDFETFLMEPDRDPEGIFTDTIDHIAPGATRLDIDATTDRTFSPDEQESGLNASAE